MRAAIQSKIAPPQGRKIQKLNDATISDKTAVQNNDKNKIDFKSVLLESNAEVAEKREARKKGDLSGAANYEEFKKELAAQTAQQEAPKNTMDKDDFLTLFVTQLQQQDPLNPKDGTEMAAQLAQFNSLEQMMNVNTTLESLVAAQEKAKNLQFLDYVGKEVSISGGKMAFNNGKINQVTFNSDNELGRATMVVKNRLGDEIYREELGLLGAGKHKLSWDGIGSDGKMNAEGIYDVEIEAQTAKGEPVKVRLNSSVTVTGIDLVKGGQNLYTDIGAINFDDIQAVGTKGFLSRDDKIKNAEDKPSKNHNVTPSGINLEKDKISENNFSNTIISSVSEKNTLDSNTNQKKSGRIPIKEKI